MEVPTLILRLSPAPIQQAGRLKLELVLWMPGPGGSA